MTRVWIGKRESDIETYPYFDYSITFWGSNKNTNFSFCKDKRMNSNYSEEFTQYVIKAIRRLQNNINEECRIYFYNNSFAYKIIGVDNSLKQYIRNLNKSYTQDLLRHKTFARLWLSNCTSVPSYVSLSKHECKYEYFKRLWPNSNRFVIQENYSGGGEGTYLLTPSSMDTVLDNLSEYKIYLISPYYENSISLSCTLMIDNCSCIVFPISQQLLTVNNHIKYCGNRYYCNDEDISIIVKHNAMKVGNVIRKIGYRGICGLDWIYSNNKLMLVEVNPRFQGSSFAINHVLKMHEMPSLFELNDLCFTSEITDVVKKSISELSIDFENHCVFQGQETSEINTDDIVFFDGYNKSNKLDEGVYLYRFISHHKNQFL